MIKISKIELDNQIKFLKDVKESYKTKLFEIKSDNKYKKLVEYLSKDGEIDDNKIERILIGSYDELIEAIKYIGEVEEGRNEIFHVLYRNFINRNLAKEWAELIGVNICPYCNRSYIHTLKSKRVRPQYDHFFPKSKYPYLAVSMYNLIPCCAICNSAKKAADTYSVSKMIYPFEEEFGYSANFTIDYDDIFIYLGESDHFKLKIDYNNISNKEIADKIKNSIEILHLEELYDKHKDYIKNILKSKYIYTDEYYESLLKSYPSLFSDINEIRNFSYFNYLEKENWDQQILSKLTFDILNDIDI